MVCFKRKKPKETKKEHRCYSNVVGSIFCKVIATQYEDYAESKGCSLNEHEQEFLERLYNKKEKSARRGATNNIYVSEK